MCLKQIIITNTELIYFSFPWKPGIYTTISIKEMIGKYNSCITFFHIKNPYYVDAAEIINMGNELYQDALAEKYAEIGNLHHNFH